MVLLIVFVLSILSYTLYKFFKSKCKLRWKLIHLLIINDENTDNGINK